MGDLVLDHASQLHCRAKPFAGYTLRMGDSYRADIELDVLRLLLSHARGVEPPNTGVHLQALINQLSDHVWSSQEHRIVYECLRAAPPAFVVPLRQQMASVATRLGHPDVDWDSYFSRPPQNVDIANLTRRLKESSS